MVEMVEQNRFFFFCYKAKQLKKWRVLSTCFTLIDDTYTDIPKMHGKSAKEVGGYGVVGTI